MEISDKRKEDFGERKKKTVGLIEALVWIIIGGIIGATALINAYSRYFIRIVLR